jgi:hypothetical protein
MAEIPQEEAQVLQGVGAQHLPIPPKVPKAPQPPCSQLEEALLKATKGRDRYPFIPINAQLLLISRDAIYKELEIARHSVPDLPVQELGHWTNVIYQSVPTGGKKTSSRRLIFGILVLMGKSGWIFDFIKAGLYDKDLPFACRKPLTFGEENPLGGEPKSIQDLYFMDDWTRQQRKEFDITQWQFLAPFFNMQAEEPPNLRLKDQIPLPFLVNEKNTKMEVVEGGFGEVSKVEIDPAHHNYQFPRSVSHPHFKRLGPRRS